jgi:glycosyltransferase involved in cell wall biosynthesis
MLTILNVAFPMAPTGPDAAGGAEQVLTMLDTALTEAGHHSIVVACEGSITRGTLVPAPPADGPSTDPQTWARAHARHRAAMHRALERWPIDVVHMHGVDFQRYLPPDDVPVLATLHLPPSWYPADVFRLARPRTYLNCVSESQRQACLSIAAGPLSMPVIRNGVPVDALAAPVRRRTFCVALGRVCPEKGFHLAIDAAKRAGAPLLIAGQVFPFVSHERYWTTEIQPRLDRERRFVGRVGFRAKRRLLSAARCVLIPSLAPETSSLVAMEALACGTPVIAFHAGALNEIVEHGRTGFLVDDEHEMAEAIGAASTLEPEQCRRAARERFSSADMARAYLAYYERIARVPRAPLAPSVEDTAVCDLAS